jgi:hypothetical protein
MYHYTNREVPYIKDHSAALRVHEDITPLKSGPMKGKRPVGDRRKTYQHIWLTPDNVVKVTVGWRDHVNCEVSFYRTGLITVAWPTGQLHGSTGMGFVAALLGIELNCRGNRPWIHGVVALKPRLPNARWDREQERIMGSFPLHRGVLIRLQRDEKYPNELTLLDPIFPSVRSVNKAGAKALREQYASFIAYAKGLYNLRDYEFTATEREEEEVNALSREDMPRLMLSDEPRDQLRAAMWLTQANKSWRWRNFNTADGTNWSHTKERALADISRTIFDAHPAQAFDWIVRHDGKVYTGPMKLNIGQR